MHEELENKTAAPESEKADVEPIGPVSEEVSVEGEAAEVTGKKEARNVAAESIKDALRQVESFGQALGEALQSRGNVVMVRVNDEALHHLDMLIEAEITKSRSESAAFLINEGIRSNEALFERISSITQQIAELRSQLRAEVKLEPQESEK